MYKRTVPIPPEAVRALATGIAPADELESSHRSEVLRWLDSTRDIYRRRKPATPPVHLVSYAVLLDPQDTSVFLAPVPPTSAVALTPT